MRVECVSTPRVASPGEAALAVVVHRATVLRRVGADSSVLECFAGLPDPRERRGIRHSLSSIMGLCLAAALAGGVSLTEITDWVSAADQDLLAALQCRRGANGRCTPPHPDTIERVLGALGAQGLADHMGDYLGHQAGLGPVVFPITAPALLPAIAVDGKAVRGAIGVDGQIPYLLAAATHGESVVIAERGAVQSPGEKHGRKRMAELAGVYDVTPLPRAPNEIISRPGEPPTSKAGPQARGKWLSASVTEDIPAVIAAAFDEAQRRDPSHRRPWIALVDGNTTQIQAIQTEATRRQVNLTIVLDFIHVLEYLWKTAWSFFDPGDPDAETWVADQATKILEGKAATVAAGIRRRATRFGYSPSERKGADQAATYLTSKKPYLDYRSALTNGWPIATGIIEGACRHIVKDRMDITGARWGLHGAQAILTLRALSSNGDFDAYWRYHLDQEHHRIHHAQYNDSHLLAA